MTTTAILFLHITAAMVYFGLPFTFGRWYRTSRQAPLAETMVGTLGQLRQLAAIHLNVAGLVLLFTGLWLATQSGLWHAQRWTHIAPVLLILSLGNINVLLLPPLQKARLAIKLSGDDGPLQKLGPRISLFSAIHHTLVTFSTVLMVFRPF